MESSMLRGKEFGQVFSYSFTVYFSGEGGGESLYGGRFREWKDVGRGMGGGSSDEYGDSLESGIYLRMGWRGNNLWKELMCRRNFY